MSNSLTKSLITLLKGVQVSRRFTVSTQETEELSVTEFLVGRRVNKKVSEKVNPVNLVDGK